MMVDTFWWEVRSRPVAGGGTALGSSNSIIEAVWSGADSTVHLTMLCLRFIRHQTAAMWPWAIPSLSSLACFQRLDSQTRFSGRHCLAEGLPWSGWLLGRADL